MTEPFLGVIGGSGLYQIDGLNNTRWVEGTSPFGKPSDACAKPGAAPGLCAASPYRIEARAKDDLNARLR